MNINGVGHAFGAQPPGQRTSEAAKPEGDTTSTARSEVEGAGKEQGVIRLLQEGHFKGVADVRLRINFSEELNAISQATTVASANEEIANVLAAVDAVVTDFLATPDLAEEVSNEILRVQGDFEEAVSGFVEAFAIADTPDANGLVADVHGAFEDFQAAVTSFLAEQVEAPIVEGEVPPPEGADEGVEIAGVIPTEIGVPDETTGEGAGNNSELSEGFQSFVESLQSVFSEALAGFNDALQSASSVLPELSEQNGNGAAYAKFLDILTALQGGVEPADSPVANDTVNLQG